jgi:hypothetical protein
VGAAAHGASTANLVAHYEARLLSGFKRHLAACRGFSRSRSPGWERETSCRQD